MDEPPSKLALAMLYVSELTGAAIKNQSGKTIGKVKDVVVRVEDLPAPVVNGLVVRTSGSELQFVPWTDAAELAPNSVILNTEAVDNRPFVRRSGEMLLIKDLRDKEVVHVEGKRVVRVNDVALAREGRRWVVSGVDSSAAALMAQLGLRGLVRKRMKRDVLPWDEVEMFEGAVPVPLNLTHDKIGRLHPADIAKVFRDLGYRQSSELLEDLPDALAADVVEDLAPAYQATLLSSLNRERAADILEEMPPDAAADVLNDILEEDPDAAEELVRTMEDDEAASVERLRNYKDNTAGGLMTTEFVTLPVSFTVREALDDLRHRRDELPQVLEMMLVVPFRGSSQLVGVVSLRTLVLSSPDDRLESVMHTEVIVRHVDDSAREAARTIAHYNLLALPILDEQEKLVGVVQINEAMDIILPKEWLHRMPHPFIGGRTLG